MKTAAVCLCLFIASVLVSLSLGQQGDICSGSIGSNFYNLQALAQATGGDVQCQDTNGNAYFYNPCNPAGVTISCGFYPDDPAAICQGDTRRPPRFHDLGSTNSVQWSARTAGPDQGFILSFSSGEDQRMSDIEFICDKTQGGKGTFEADSPTESPIHDYHLTYRTTFACPTNGPSSLQCCSYTSAYGDTQKGLCMFANAPCPSFVGSFSNTGSTNATSCDECTFGPIDRTCCVYMDSNTPPDFTTDCVSNRECNIFLDDNTNIYKNVANFTVPDCDGCFF